MADFQFLRTGQVFSNPGFALKKNKKCTLLGIFRNLRIHGLFSNLKKAEYKYTLYSQILLVAEKRTPGVLFFENRSK